MMIVVDGAVGVVVDWGACIISAFSPVCGS